MAVRRLETVRYALPFRRPYVTVRGELKEREMLLVRLQADEGVGIGETTALSLRKGAGIAEIEREVHRLWPIVEGSAVDSDGVFESIDLCHADGLPEAVCAIDLALWDLLGKATGKPVWRLLGARKAAPVRCNASLIAEAPAAAAGEAERWADQGFATFKLKVGVDDDVQQVAAVRAAVGPAARIRVDANGVWNLAQAAERLEAMASSNLELAEEPVSGIPQMSRLRERADVPIYADESVSSIHEATEASGACDGATVKLAKVGGIARSGSIAERLRVYLSSALDGPIGIAAAYHLAQAIPDAGLAHGLATQRLFAGTIAAAGPELDGDRLTVPDAPGLGVEIDESALSTYRK